MSRPTLHDVHPQNAPLQNISIAYSNGVYIAEQVFPIVSVEKKSDFYFVYDKSSWFRNRSGPRAPGAKAPRADYGVTTASYICINDSLAKEIPDEVRDNADSPLQPDVEATEFVTDGLMLGLEIRVADIITASAGQWATAASPTTQWSSDSSDPFGDIMAGMNTLVSTIGRKPNLAVTSWDVWRFLVNHPDFLDRIKYTRPGGKLEPSDIQSWFEFDKFLIGTSLKDIAQEGKTASMQYVWGDDFWMGWVSPTPSLRTPSAGYVFTWKTRQLTRFREDQNHQDVIEIEHFTAEKVSASDAGYIIYDAV